MTSDSTPEPGDMQRRGFLKCMTWAGTAMVWTVAGGVPRSRLIGSAEAATGGFTFVQVSDSHLGFSRPENPDVTATLQDALGEIVAMPKTWCRTRTCGRSDISMRSREGIFACGC